MPVFVFQILPILMLIALVFGVVLISRGISHGKAKQRMVGMVCVAVFVLLLVSWLLMGLARL